MPDPNYWPLEMVRAETAQQLVRGAQGGGAAIDWGEVWVAHPDTGYTEHPVFGFQGGQSPVLLVDRGVNFVEPGTPPKDSLTGGMFAGHGTRTGSVLCGNQAPDLRAAAPGVPTVPYRVNDSTLLFGKAAKQNLANAIRRAIDDNGCDVVSISMGINILNPFDRALGRAVDHAYENGVIVVGAGGQIVDVVVYPGKFFRAVGVGGVTPAAEVWPDSQYDRDLVDFIDVWAPADPIRRADTKADGAGGERYVYGDNGDGTSYATVLVAAAAALWLVFRRDDINRTYSEAWQRIEAFKALLKSTARPIVNNPDVSARTGALLIDTGILDIEALLKADLPRPTTLKPETRLAANQWG